MDGIEFDPIGTVTVTIDNKPYKLRRPKLREYRYHRDEIRALSIKAVEHLDGLRTRLDSLDETSEEYAALEAEITHISRNSFELTSVPWLTAVFDDLGSPLPDDFEDWPAWLAADQSIPTKIITHWRTVPLAPGSKTTS